MEKTIVKFRFHSDAGHGWLEVRRNELNASGLTAVDFSYCSYRASNGTLYLEEDCDAPKFLDAYKKNTGNEIEFEEIEQDPSPIRAMNHIPH